MDFSLSDHEFKTFKEFIYEKSGIYFSDVNKAILENRLFEIMLKYQYKSVLDYFKILNENSVEVKNFLDLITTNLTKFFRNQPQFDALKDIILPDLAKRNQSSKTIKAWSAGCSSGEEPYSIAMILADHFGFTSGWEIKIIASDISLKSLLIAREGFYKKDRTTEIPKELIDKYCLELNDGYKIKESIKKLITFDYHNLTHDFSHKNFDIVFCRNVIIYFDQVAQKNVIERFYNYLKPYGYLFLGHSESLFGMNTKFKFNKLGNAITYLKDTSA